MQLSCLTTFEAIQVFFIDDFMTFVGAPHDRRYVMVQMQFDIRIPVTNQTPRSTSIYGGVLFGYPGGGRRGDISSKGLIFQNSILYISNMQSY